MASLKFFADFGASFLVKQPENGIKLSTLLATLSLLSTAIFAHVVTNRRSVALQKKSENFIAKKTEPIILLSRSVLGLGSKGTLKRRIFIVSRWSERARNVGMNPEFITLIISVMNSGFIPIFRDHSNRREMMKICHLRVLLVLTYLHITVWHWTRIQNSAIYRSHKG